MAVSTSSSSFSSSSKSSTFTDGVRYALSQLGKPDLKLKDKQQQAIAAVYSLHLLANWLWQEYLLSGPSFSL